MPGGAACPPKGYHPSRHQTVQRAGDAAGWGALGQDYRLRHRQGPGPTAHGQDLAYRLRSDDWHAALHGARADISRPFAPPEPDDGAFTYSRDVYAFAVVCLWALSEIPIREYGDIAPALAQLDVVKD